MVDSLNKYNMQNWFFYLPIAGLEVRSQALYIRSLTTEIELLKNQIAVLEQNKQLQEEQLQQKVDDEWTKDEQERLSEMYKKILLEHNK